MPPIPKRSEVRRRNNKVPGLERAEGAPAVPVPNVDPSWHPMAKDWFRSLKRSGQSRFYEPSDWQYARFVAQMMSSCLESPNAAIFRAVVDATAPLMATEGQRRRMRLELIRPEAAKDRVSEAEDDVASILRAIPSA